MNETGRYGFAVKDGEYVLWYEAPPTPVRRTWLQWLTSLFRS